eukprot:scaffold748_cov251-Pinguiococcus_pyrenoidosus.AAC.42
MIQNQADGQPAFCGKGPVRRRKILQGRPRLCVSHHIAFPIDPLGVIGIRIGGVAALGRELRPRSQPASKVRLSGNSTEVARAAMYLSSQACGRRLWTMATSYRMTLGQLERIAGWQKRLERMWNVSVGTSHSVVCWTRRR